MAERKKYYPFKIEFQTQEEHDKFSNYVNSVKQSKRKAISKIAIDMIEAHRGQK